MKQYNRRDFLKVSGTVAATSALSACGGKQNGGGEIDLDPMGHHTDPVPTGKMTYRTNPKTGDKVSLLGYGWMRLPTKRVGDGPNNEVIDQEQVNRLTNYALEHGVNYFDTSPAYCRGKSEESLGIALEQSGRPRDSYFIATKLSNFSPQQYSFEEGCKIFENSLQYLKTDYIDYLLLHSIGGGGMDNLRQRFLDNGLLDWLMEQREKGRIRNLGFSFHGDVAVFDYMLEHHDKYKWDFVQIQANYVDWNQADGRIVNGEYLYNELEKRGIPAVIMEPLLGGRLSKVPDHVVAHLKQRKPENSVASWAFRYIGSKPDVLTVLSGMTYMEHLRDNIFSYAPLKPISKEENDFLMEVAEDIYNLKTIPCNECNYCMPCPYGINIPAILAHYNKCIKEGNIPHVEEEQKKHMEAAEYRRRRRAFLIGYDRSVPKLRQANHCIQCGQCSPHCPQRIDIPKEMRRIDEFTEALKREGRL